jgi:lon-related putative ATP-dependent protease
MNYDGYNIYLAGLTGTGKTSSVQKHINKLLEKKYALAQIKPPEDWCYIYNFLDPDRPQIINLSKGEGKVFRDKMNTLLHTLKEDLLKAFTSEEYKEKTKSVLEQNQNDQRKLLEAIREEIYQQGFLLQITPIGPAIVPLKDGKPMTQEEFSALEDTARHTIEANRERLIKKVESIFEQARDIEREAGNKLLQLDKDIADIIISKSFEESASYYKENAVICRYLDDLKKYTITSLDVFKGKKDDQPETVMGIPTSFIMKGIDPFLPFQINVFVDNSETSGPPVIVESNPNYSNLFGKVERRFLLGGSFSDHTMLKPGTIHQANGGYLLLNARDVLTNTAVWPALKRTIKTKEARIEEPWEQLGLYAPVGLRPQPMPVDVKILLIGDTTLYQLLAMYDEDFWEIFKVKADFNYKIDRTRKNMMHFAAFITGCCNQCDMHHFDKTGVARVIEYASRIVEDQEKLTSRFAIIREIIQEAEYWCRKDNADLVSARHIDRAIDERYFRHNLPDEHIQEIIDRGTIMIDIRGAVVGQVNGLSIYSLGDISFGKPSRITCKTFLGRSGVINIERESQLSGRIHDKGVLILNGYLGWKYAQEHPLSLSASLCFEQSYEGVDGDSASSTELYALISSISGIPIKQGIAVTGSVNQKGEIQPIGDVNQKIEGFYRVCRARGLTGDQGVMIPRSNVINLMLRQEVIDSVKEGKFHIYAVNTIDEGIEVLTGRKAGKQRKDGSYTADTINYLVTAKLKDMAARLRDFYGPEKNINNQAS